MTASITISGIGLGSFGSIKKVFLKNIKKIPNLKVVLAHLGYIKSPRKVDQLLTNNKQIYTDLSLVTNSRFGPFKRKGLIIKRVPSKKWIKILEKHDDRILVGSDIGADVQRVKRLNKVANDYRILLSHLKKKFIKTSFVLLSNFVKKLRGSENNLVFSR